VNPGRVEMFTEISTEEEIERVVPVVKELAKLNIQLSIDTYRSEVAEATNINDIHTFFYHLFSTFDRFIH
jgi:dihydropteroate synthase